MSRRKKKYGKCKLCGAEGRLSFEHVPPSKAFNNEDYYYATCEELMKYDLDDNLEYPTNLKKGTVKKGQGGFGYYSLCEKCNNNTGSWYGSDFISWIYQSMGILLKTKHKPTLYYPTFFFPLRVIKQIVCMFFSINQYGFNENEPELVSFVLNKEKRYLSSKYKIYCYYNIVGKRRYIGDVFLGNFKTGGIIHMSELAFPPLGFVMTIDSNSPSADLTDISRFANYSYGDWIDYYQCFKVLPTHISYIPGDYRSKEEILKGIEESKKYKKP